MELVWVLCGPWNWAGCCVVEDAEKNKTSEGAEPLLKSSRSSSNRASPFSQFLPVLKPRRLCSGHP